MNRCPICFTKIQESKLMCWPHWDMVPKLQQDQVLGLWKITLRGANPSIRRLAMQEYKKARDAAIAVATQKAEEYRKARAAVKEKMTAKL